MYYYYNFNKDRRFFSVINNDGCVHFKCRHTHIHKDTFSTCVFTEADNAYIRVYMYIYFLCKRGVYFLHMKHSYLLRDPSFLIQTVSFEYTSVYFLHLVKCRLGRLPGSLQLAVTSLGFCGIPGRYKNITFSTHKWKTLKCGLLSDLPHKGVRSMSG